MEIDAASSKCLLLVEDCELVAQVTTDFLTDAGFSVDCADSVIAAFQKMEKSAFDIALLDINVGRELVYPVAEHLAELGVPFVFVSGGHSGTIPQRLAGRPFLTKH